MKRIIYQLCVLCVICQLASACSDFLEVKEKGRTTIPAFLSDPDGLYSGLVGAYNKMYAYYDNEFTKYPDVAGNMLSMKFVSAGTDMLDQYNFTSDALQETGAVGYIWRKIYEALANVNNVIQYQPEVLANYPAKGELCQRILGEALFLRALCHFDLCRVYAQPYNYSLDASHLGVPILLKTPGPDDNVSRESVRKVYEQILKDLQQATACFDNISSKGIHYASLQAVNALYSRVYLYMENWEKALEYAKLTIGTGQLAKKDAYLAMYQDFSVDGEAIFRLNGLDQSGKLKAFYDSSCSPADTLFTLFDERDIRLSLLRDASGIAYCSK